MTADSVVGTCSTAALFRLESFGRDIVDQLKLGIVNYLYPSRITFPDRAVAAGRKGRLFTDSSSCLGSLVSRSSRKLAGD